MFEKAWPGAWSLQRRAGPPKKWRAFPPSEKETTRYEFIQHTASGVFEHFRLSNFVTWSHPCYSSFFSVYATTWHVLVRETREHQCGDTGEDANSANHYYRSHSYDGSVLPPHSNSNRSSNNNSNNTNTVRPGLLLDCSDAAPGLLQAPLGWL